MIVIGRTILVEDEILCVSICLVFREPVEIGKAHERHTDNLIPQTSALFVKTAVFPLRQFRKDLTEFHCAFLDYAFLPLNCYDRSNGCFKHVSMSVYE